MTLRHLSDPHRSELRDESRIADAVIEARGYRTITDAKELAALGFAPKQQLVPGLLMPGHGPDGSNGFYAFKPVFPRQARNGKGELINKFVKYEMQAGARMRLDVPPVCQPMLTDPSIPAWITEGIKKADSLASHGFCAICLYGVWNFKGKNEFGGVTVLADFDFIAWQGRDVRIVFDSDVMVKPEVRKALERLTEILQRKGAHVSAVYLPGGRDNKVGVDDFLREHTPEELKALVDVPRPQPQPASPTYELLDSPPPALRRPLALIEGRAYAAAWPYVRKEVSETLDSKTGHIIKHDPPIVTQERRLIIIRDDGATFGEGGKYPAEDLGFELILPEIPPDKTLWRAFAVRAFVQKQRPNASDLFRQVCEVVERFIDFDRSFAGQQEMCEMIACYIFATWFLDAFTVIGFIWPNGERGSGKTQLLTIVAELSYLGQLILAGGSFAALRDMADYGAFLAFDDAENLSDPKQSDPDKRTLLLAGNRRGNTVPLKEPVPGERTWRTRYVNTFCPRGFSAIRTPDATLGSRTIVIPLIRTPLKDKANIDPADYTVWPHDRSTLVDDLWALSLANLNALSAYEAQVNQRSRLTGRNLEPWRALLSVALWLEDQGVTGLWERMEALSIAYQGERRELESGDMTVLIIRALCRSIGADVADITDVADIRKGSNEWTLTTKFITETAKTIAEELELDINLERITARNIGRKLGQLRFKNAKKGRSSERAWCITSSELERFLISLNIISVQPIVEKVTSATSATSVCPQVLIIPPDIESDDFDEQCERIAASHNVSLREAAAIVLQERAALNSM